MSALVFVIGLFVPQGVARHGAVGYLRRRVELVLYLYLLWFVLQTSVEILSSGVKNHPRDPSALLRPWETFNQLWFLPLLAIATVAVVMFRPWQSPRRAACGLVATGVLAASTWGMNYDVVGGHGLSLIVFAMAGATIGLARMSTWMTGRRLCWAVAGLIGVAGLLGCWHLGAYPPSLGNIDLSLRTVAVSGTAAICGVVALLSASTMLSFAGPRIRSALSTVGRYTLPIFLAHVIVSAGIRVAFMSFGWTDPIFVVGAGAILGVAVPLYFAVWARDRVWAAWLFELPRRIPSSPNRAWL